MEAKIGFTIGAEQANNHTVNQGPEIQPQKWRYRISDQNRRCALIRPQVTSTSSSLKKHAEKMMER